MKNHSIKLALSLLLALSAFGCVAQQEHDDLKTLYRTSQEQIVELHAKLDDARAQLEALRNAPPKPHRETLDKLASATERVNELEAALAQAEQNLAELRKRRTPLPEELNKELAELAADNAGLMAYDKDLGMVKLTSDLTFASGSDQVSEAAATSLTKLAEILNGPLATKYEVRIVGHTDNVRIAQPDTLAMHPTNWHLSAHRAITVKDVLVSAGIDQVRLNVSGYGEYRPIVPNQANGARPNRRVEIFLISYAYQPIEQPAEPEGPPPEAVPEADNAADPAAFK